LELFLIYGGGQTVEVWNCSVVLVVDRLELFCSLGGGQTVELWACSVVMVVD